MTPSGSQGESKLKALFRKLSDLWDVHHQQSNATNASIRSTAYSNADTSCREPRYIFEGSLKAARKLWSQTEALIAETVDIDGDGESGLLGQCKRLLTACDDLVVAQEESLRLYDLSAEPYVSGISGDENDLESDFFH